MNKIVYLLILFQVHFICDVISANVGRPNTNAPGVDLRGVVNYVIKGGLAFAESHPSPTIRDAGAAATA